MYSSNEIRAKLMDGAVESIGRCAELVNTYCEGEKKKEQLKKLEDLMEKCCHVENKFGIAKASLLEVQKVVKQHNMTDGEENDGPEINIREVFNKKMEEKSANAPSAKKHEKYVAFEKKIQLLQAEAGVNDDDDDDVAVTNSEVLTVDPITKQMMTDPIRIKKCGHTFERSSIMCLLKNKKHIRCPIPGCLQTRVTATDLEEHHELKLKLVRAKQASGRDMA